MQPFNTFKTENSHFYKAIGLFCLKLKHKTRELVIYFIDIRVEVKMFTRKVDNEIELELATKYIAKDIFDIINKNRDNLKQRFTWLNSVKEPTDTKEYIESRLELMAKGKTIYMAIRYQGKVVGVIDFNSINEDRKTAEIGYILDIEYRGKGIMRRAVKELCNMAFNTMGMNKVIIRCAHNNPKSCNVAKSLGFKLEGTLREFEEINGTLIDLNIFSLLKREYEA